MRIGTLVGLTVVLASAPAGARTFDLVEYTPPAGWKVEEKPGERVTLTRVTGDAYCVVGIYAGAPASASLEASFAAEWKAVALRTVDAGDAPVPTVSALGNTRAALGVASSTIQGSPVAVVLVVLDAGPSVVSILILAPSPEAFEPFTAEVRGLLDGLAVRRPQEKGKLVVPPPSRALTLGDLAGEWVHNDGFTSTYYERQTGAYAGAESLAYREKWTISPKGSVTTDYFGIRNGKKLVEKRTGAFRLSGRVVEIKIGAGPKYVVRGWLELPETTVLKLVGPFYGDVPKEVLEDPTQGRNLEQHWVRQRAKSK